jgi:thiol-disulfide isomerase/thioredoxin
VREATLRAAAVLLPLLGLPALPYASLAQAPNGAIQGLQPTSEYSLVAEGKPVPAAEIYLSAQPPALLILTSALAAPVMLTPRIGRVDTVNLMKVAKQTDGSVDLLPDAVLQPAGYLTIEGGGSVAFTVGKRKMRLVPKPPLLGLRTNEDLKAYLPEYVRGAQRYIPNAAGIASLRKQGSPVTVRVYFGSWCPHCRQLVPSLLRVQDEVRNPKIRYEYYGLPHTLDDPEAKKAGVHSVPIGVVFAGGREIGRINTDGWIAPEVTLDKILKAPKR